MDCWRPDSSSACRGSCRTPPLYAETASGTVPPALEVAAIFFYFVPYRMLMVRVYDHTQSVLLAILMHLPLIVFLFNLLSSGDGGGTWN